ncbi:unnamed protein product [Cuscuta epithymum]|uniref:GAG-pre-integrase domain-containing protein n=1 Tax=Cuscuta epithymum TaxID=186058 RepID=A0AAV0E2V1_9ASTE|nr:unnamed protein product [Cuscuta epithymum]
MDMGATARICRGAMEAGTGKASDVLHDISTACSTSGSTYQHSDWIFDCGATDTMSFELSDFDKISKAQKRHVQTANEELLPVQGAGTIKISESLKIPNCLYVPSLAHKLLSVSHVTKELNCTLLMQPSFCMLHHIRTGTIVGHGTEQNGLYFVDEITQQGNALLTHGSPDRLAWLWYRRLGHPSFVYLKTLFPQFENFLTCTVIHAYL